MKQNVDKIFGGLNVGSITINRGWNKVKNKNLHIVPFSSIVLSKELIDLIELSTLHSIDKFGWYSFFDNYTYLNDVRLYDKENYEIFPGEMVRLNNHVKVLYEISHGFNGPYCSWNEDLNVGFLKFNHNYGYFIKYK